jgi:hypothetical protein
VTILEQPVFSSGQSKPFGDLTREEVAARAAELRSVGGVGPTTRVVPVAMAWAELARAMERAGANVVRDLSESELANRAERLWIVPPGGSLLH